jgi:uncharacterized protein
VDDAPTPIPMSVSRTAGSFAESPVIVHEPPVLAGGGGLLSLLGADRRTLPPCSASRHFPFMDHWVPALIRTNVRPEGTYCSDEAGRPRPDWRQRGRSPARGRSHTGRGLTGEDPAMTVEHGAQRREQNGRTVPTTGAAIECLSREESLNLLGSQPIGRLVYTRQALPAVEPVNFALSKGEIIIRADGGGKLAAAVRGDVVAFEADVLDTAVRSGWSVTVIGRSREASDPEEISRLRALPLVSWSPGDKDHFICIDIEIVNGRRLGPSYVGLLRAE